MSEDKNTYQAALLFNRLTKRYKHLKKWAKRTNVTCFRVYDRDIPEIPLAIDIFEAETDMPGENGELYAQIALYERPYEKDEAEEDRWLSCMAQAVSDALKVPDYNIVTKVRKHQKGDAQYGRLDERSLRFVVREQGQRFIVNLSDYLDTGLFFDHRPLRLQVRNESAKKHVLNLFCYTGAFSVYASSGKASSVDSVDLSATYLKWAEENMKLNGHTDNTRYRFFNSDVLSWLYETKKSLLEAKAPSEDPASRLNPAAHKYDIIVLDPPTFSNSKKTENTLDINRDWPEFVNLCCTLLNEGGILYFSTNSRRLQFDASKLMAGWSAQDISDTTIPEDFRNVKIHRCWKISKITNLS